MRPKGKWILLAVVFLVTAILVFLFYPRKLLSFLKEPSNVATEASVMRDSIDGVDVQRLYGEDLNELLNQAEDIRLMFCGFYGLSGTYIITHGENGKYTYTININRRSDTELKSLGQIYVTDEGQVYIGHAKYRIVSNNRSDWLAYLQELFG